MPGGYVEHPAFFHNHVHCFQRLEVGQRIAVNQDEICALARIDCPDQVTQAHGWLAFELEGVQSCFDAYGKSGPFRADFGGRQGRQFLEYMQQR